MSNTTLDYPVLGGGDKSKSGLVSLSIPSYLPFEDQPSTSTTSPLLTSSLFTSTLSSSGSIYSAECLDNKAKEALASSKLKTVTQAGPVEPTPVLSKRQLKRDRKHERSLTKGSAWFNMAKTEITKEKKNDLEALKLRSAMDRVLHYKRNNITHTPNYFHVGTIVETSADFYSSRIPKKQRKKTLAQEFAADYGMA